MPKARLPLLTLLISVPAAAQAAAPLSLPSIPTLDEWGLIGLSVALGSLGAWLVSRRK